MLSKASRLHELYRRGGPAEVHRGVRDFVMNNTAFHRLVQSRDLEAGGLAVKIGVNSQETFWRGRGHGEGPVLEAFVDAVSAEDTVWDVGANIGSYALLAAEVGANVVAFEPGAEARAQLVANAERNGLRHRIDPTPIALSDAGGTATLGVSESTGSRALTDGGIGTTVPTERGDALEVPEPDVVKIDVEGAECAVLNGMVDRLASVRECFVEVHDGVGQVFVAERLHDAGLTTEEMDVASRDEVYLHGVRK